MRHSFTLQYCDDDILVVEKPAGLLSVPDRYEPEVPALVVELRKALAAGLALPKGYAKGVVPAVPAAALPAGPGAAEAAPAASPSAVDPEAEVEDGAPAAAADPARGAELLVVHRLDKDTSGLLIFARNAEAHRRLNGAFGTGAVKKTYRAIVKGSPAWEETGCDLPLHVDGDRRHRTVIDGHHGKDSKTSFTVLERYRGGGGFAAALVEARPETGRTHQIRVHLSALGHACLCDPLYGDGQPLLLSKVKGKWKGDEWSERPLLSRTALHAFSLEFAHPMTGVRLRFEAPEPKDFRAARVQLEKL
ncbi:MAG: RluA family pseudouridine synthase [Spirochaetaceae bacterium]|nr:RluA family pseudouridine synthase [Spirochaetaceae bacterium]